MNTLEDAYVNIGTLNEDDIPNINSNNISNNNTTNTNINISTN